jgi:oligopeptide/dipeptide ABC transporter ATP-binding protein
MLSQREEEAMMRPTGPSDATDALIPPRTGQGSTVDGTTPETLTRSPVLLSVDRLHKRFPVRIGLYSKAYVSAVDNVSFTVEAGTTLGIVGESGCGKSTTARLVVGLIAPDAGTVAFEGVDVQTLTGLRQKTLRRNMQMVFQDPYSALNPRMSIGESIAFPLRAHGYSKSEQRERTGILLAQVGLHPNHASYYPHQMSGGQRQRVNIARALALEPRLVIADEAVSALDKSVQAQVLNLLTDLQEQLKLTYIFISHDLNVVQYVSDHVLVMYLGQVVEHCTPEALYAEPLHPYTKVLLASIPDVNPDQPPAAAFEGEIPSALSPPSGCRFRTRCATAMPICTVERPPLIQERPGHFVACHLYGPSAPAGPGEEKTVAAS